MSSVRALVLPLLLAACGSESSSTSSDASTPPTGDADAAATSTQDGGASGTPGTGDQGCELSADHVVSIPLDASSFTQNTVEVGASFEWSLVAMPEIDLPAFAPGDTVSVRVDLSSAPLTIQRAARNLYVDAEFGAGGSTTAQVAPTVEVGARGSVVLGPWQPSLSTNAGGKPIRLRLGAIGVNPNTGEQLDCIALRATIPSTANRVDDSSLIDLAASEPLPLEALRLSLSGDGDAEPFGLTLGE